MRVAILGAGSVGCFIGGAWAAAGVPVTFVGRQAIGEAIAKEGLTLTDHKGWRVRLAPDQVDFQTKPSGIARADLIALCVKSNATAAVAPDIDVHQAPDLEAAIATLAARQARFDTIILSPGAPSYNQFKNFEERGARFVDLCRARFR